MIIKSKLIEINTCLPFRNPSRKWCLCIQDQSNASRDKGCKVPYRRKVYYIKWDERGSILHGHVSMILGGKEA